MVLNWGSERSHLELVLSKLLVDLVNLALDAKAVSTLAPSILETIACVVRGLRSHPEELERVLCDRFLGVRKPGLLPSGLTGTSVYSACPASPAESLSSGSIQDPCCSPVSGRIAARAAAATALVLSGSLHTSRLLRTPYFSV